MHLCKPAMVLGIFCHYHRHPATLEIKRNLIDFFANDWPASALTLHPYLRAPLYRAGF